MRRIKRSLSLSFGNLAVTWLTSCILSVHSYALFSIWQWSFFYAVSYCFHSFALHPSTFFLQTPRNSSICNWAITAISYQLSHPAFCHKCLNFASFTGASWWILNRGGTRTAVSVCMWPWSFLRRRGRHKSRYYATASPLILPQHRCGIQSRLL